MPGGAIVGAVSMVIGHTGAGVASRRYSVKNASCAPTCAVDHGRKQLALFRAQRRQGVGPFPVVCAVQHNAVLAALLGVDGTNAGADILVKLRVGVGPPSFPSGITSEPDTSTFPARYALRPLWRSRI